MTQDQQLARKPGTPPPSLYAKREPVFNRRIDGRFRRIKWAVMALCLAVYWVTPWLRWDRGAYAPDQAVLIDLAHRRFYMFGIEIWPHEFYFVAGLLIMAGIGLFLVTSAVGRAWCGYACPQTVWTDLFQHVDRLIDGDRNQRFRLYKAPWGPSKIARRLVKWTIYLAISFATGGAWIFYFADAPTLQRAFWTGTADPVAYATVAVLTATTFVLGGFMREQVCIYMCPWPRIQTAMTDEKSLTVTYKDWRGEPRGSLKKALKAPDAFGDCIDCNQCVAVCPTGIDIREGAQVGCITCALCIDACDRVMKDVGRPRGLIDYATLEDAQAEKAGKPPTPHLKLIWRPRTIAYFLAWSGIGLGLLFLLGARVHTEVTVAKDRNPPFIVMSDGSIRNAYTLRLRNMQARPRRMEIVVEGLPGAVMWTGDTARQQASARLLRMVPADATQPLRVYVVAPSGTRARDFAFTVQAVGEPGEADRSAATFDTPEG
ncbi:cytochrome c oxidase accessory protein CcoG [Novosphingobium sp. FGD1]|uniref:Cytochrome c oxidase accessory protein CcoG n=1 Tax=Novosphingobium silvae TaxID=2692619 RepID=A0A7X4GJA3_9SPHN|nr:cytochrome c oxidase accessory protein CcoG [Novosphingobium silvae]MYL99671.1 cytochrome c oxidase accessory protein CcoG [Novosphingobium silvae]